MTQSGAPGDGSLLALLGGDHRRLNRLLDEVRAAVTRGDLGSARTAFAAWTLAMELHMRWEERVLFPAYERVTGRSSGPTRVMRVEHAEVLELAEAGARALANGRVAEIAALLEDIETVLRTHEAKEERILFAGSDRLLDEDEHEEVVASLRHAVAANGDGRT